MNDDLDKIAAELEDLKQRLARLEGAVAAAKVVWESLTPTTPGG